MTDHIDFEYLQEDEALAKSNLLNYRQADKSGFKWGTIIGLPLGYLLARPVNLLFRSRKTYFFVPLVTASVMYIPHNAATAY